MRFSIKFPLLKSMKYWNLSLEESLRVKINRDIGIVVLKGFHQTFSKAPDMLWSDPATSAQDIGP
jgi:hypothetical protein